MEPVGVTESLEHYFLHCNRFSVARRNFLELFLTLNNFNFQQLISKEKIKVILYGLSSRSKAVNRSLINSTLLYIKTSNRFD